MTAAHIPALLLCALLAACGGGGEAYVPATATAKCAPALPKPEGGAAACNPEGTQ